MAGEGVLPFSGGGGWLQPILLAGVIELGWHLFWHFTAPGAHAAMWLADALGLTASFSDAAGAVDAAGLALDSASQSVEGFSSSGAFHSAAECTLPFCPIHNPDLSVFEGAAGAVAADPVTPLANPAGAGNVGNLPVFDLGE